MALAMIYPEPEKGGRSHTKQRVEETSTVFSSKLLQQARTILRHSAELAQDVLHRGEHFDVALKKVQAETQQRKGHDAQMADLRAHAPDVAALVTDGRLLLGNRTDFASLTGNSGSPLDLPLGHGAVLVGNATGNGTVEIVAEAARCDRRMVLGPARPPPQHGIDLGPWDGKSGAQLPVAADRQRPRRIHVEHGGPVAAEPKVRFSSACQLGMPGDIGHQAAGGLQKTIV
jgi:hypothetical protein